MPSMHHTFPLCKALTDKCLDKAEGRFLMHHKTTTVEYLNRPVYG